MNALFHRLGRLLALAATVLLAHCGGVGQDGSGATPPDSYNTGVVNGFGSVVVNGIHFDVRNADIVVDGVHGRRESDLRVGMVVQVSGRVAADGLTGSANRVSYESLLRGRLDALSSTGAVLQVLGQQVVVDDTTLFVNAGSAAELAVGDELQVSGLRVHDGTLRATLVVREAASASRQLSAFLTGVSGSTVQLAGLNIDIGTAELVDVTLSTLAAGQLVRVDLQAAPVAGAAVATRLRLIDTTSAESLSKQQRQGFVMGWNAGTGRFRIDEQTVQVLPATQYQDGDVTQLATGARVEVTGLRGTDGLLRAAKVRFLRSTLSAYGRGSVVSVDAPNQRFMLLDANGVEVRVNPATLLNDNTGGTLNLTNLTPGQEVLVLGVANGTRIEAEVVTRLANNPVGSGLGGPVQNIVGTSFVLLGVTVNPGLSVSYFDAQGNPMTETAFFSGLQAGDLVRAEGSFIDATDTLRAAVVRRVQ
jgi:hypothetical protein